jgi:hypothetical protein
MPSTQDICGYMNSILSLIGRHYGDLRSLRVASFDFDNKALFKCRFSLSWVTRGCLLLSLF